MDRRGFLHVLSQLAATAGLTGVARGADRQPAVKCRRDDRPPTFRDLGWAWEGQGLDPQVPPSIYGLGQGARCFGLSMEGIARLVKSGKLAGYTILAAVLIDGHRPQADAVRDFVASES